MPDDERCRFHPSYVERRMDSPFESEGKCDFKRAELVLVTLYFENLPQITTIITFRFIKMTSPVFI